MAEITQEQMDRIVQTYNQLVSLRSRHIPKWQDITRFIFPQADCWDDIDPNDTALADRREIFDDTAPQALEQYANGLQSWAFGESIDWIGLKREGVSSKSQGDGERKYFQWVARRIASLLSHSNFYTESNLFCKQGGALGTAIIRFGWDEVQQCPEYECIHVKDAVGMQNRHRIVDTLYWCVWLNRSDAIDMLGSEDALPRKIRDCKDESRNFKFIQVSCPQDRFRLDLKGGRYVNVIWYEKDPRKPLKVWTEDYQQFAVWRPGRALGGDMFGSSCPGDMAIHDVKMLNAMEKATVKSAQLTAEPPIKKTKGLKVNFYPLGQTELDSDEDFALVQGAGGNLQWTENSKLRIRQSISSVFFLDFFMAVSQRKDKQMTAAEVYTLTDEQAKMMAPFISRLKSEFLEPVIENIFMQMRDRGLLQDDYDDDGTIPEELKEYTDMESDAFRLKNIEVDYVSPLTRVQRRAYEVTPTRQVIQDALAMAQIDQTVLDNVDLGRFLRISGEVENADLRVMRSQKQVDEIRRARAQQMAQQQMFAQQMEQTKTNADAYAKLNQPMQEGSPVASQFGGGMGANA